MKPCWLELCRLFQRVWSCHVATQQDMEADVAKSYSVSPMSNVFTVKCCDNIISYDHSKVEWLNKISLEFVFKKVASSLSSPQCRRQKSVPPLIFSSKTKKMGVTESHLNRRHIRREVDAKSRCPGLKFTDLFWIAFVRLCCHIYFSSSIFLKRWNRMWQQVFINYWPSGFCLFTPIWA